MKMKLMVFLCTFSVGIFAFANAAGQNTNSQSALSSYWTNWNVSERLEPNCTYRNDYNQILKQYTKNEVCNPRVVRGSNNNSRPINSRSVSNNYGGNMNYVNSENNYYTQPRTNYSYVSPNLNPTGGMFEEYYDEYVTPVMYGDTSEESLGSGYDEYSETVDESYYGSNPNYESVNYSPNTWDESGSHSYGYMNESVDDSSYYGGTGYDATSYDTSGYLDESVDDSSYYSMDASSSYMDGGYGEEDYSY